MKSSRSVLSMLMLILATAASGQSADQPVAAMSDVQKTFALMKTLAGDWRLGNDRQSCLSH